MSVYEHDTIQNGQVEGVVNAYRGYRASSAVLLAFVGTSQWAVVAVTPYGGLAGPLNNPPA